MLTLRPYSPSDFAKLNYQLDEPQSEFTAPIGCCIDERKDLNDRHKTVVTIAKTVVETTEDDGGEPIGFFVLDIGDDKFGVTDNVNAVLIRCFSINSACQGKGYGRQAMTLTSQFVKEYLLGVNELALSVNFRNVGAYQVYLKVGYRDTGRVIVGIAGEQHVMSKLV